MPTNELADAVVLERTFDAPIERVWNALTDVEQMRQWYFDLKEFKADPDLNLNSWSNMRATNIITSAK